MRYLKHALPLIMLVLTVWGCGGKTDTEEERRGRVSFVKTLKYGSVGTHGGQGWYVSDQNFYVDGSRWKPPAIKVDDIAGCHVSPNERIEALQCYSFADNKEAVYVLRVAGEKPEWVTVTDQEYAGGKNLGEWVGDTEWLIFKDYFYNVLTSEKKEIRGLPDYPEDYFQMASPDLETVVYAETGFTSRFDLPPGADVDKERERQYKVFYDHVKNGIAAFWVVDVRTGAVKLLELRKDKYDWLVWDQNRFPSKSDWHKFFQDQFVWDKDKNGKYQLSIRS